VTPSMSRSQGPVNSLPGFGHVSAGSVMIIPSANPADEVVVTAAPRQTFAEHVPTSTWPATSNELTPLISKTWHTLIVESIVEAANVIDTLVIPGPALNLCHTSAEWTPCKDRARVGSLNIHVVQIVSYIRHTAERASDPGRRRAYDDARTRCGRIEGAGHGRTNSPSVVVSMLHNRYNSPCWTYKCEQQKQKLPDHINLSLSGCHGPRPHAHDHRRISAR